MWYELYTLSAFELMTIGSGLGEVNFFSHFGPVFTWFGFPDYINGPETCVGPNCSTVKGCPSDGL